MIRAIQPLLTLLLLLLFATILTNAYPDQCNCDLAIAVGTNFGALHGNGPAVLGSAFTLSVMNGTTPIISGSQVLAGLTLTVTTDPPTNTAANDMYIIESTGGQFLDATTPVCTSGSRTNNASPTSNTLGVAKSHQLQLTNLGNYSITMAYTSVSGSVLSISPSFTFEVVGIAVSGKPVTAPTIDNSVNQTERMGLSIGLTISLVFVGIALFFLSTSYTLSTITFSAILQDDNFISNFFFVSALIALAITISLTLAWATNSGQGALGYLGSPDWMSNPLSYHVIFMITLVFTFQLFFYIFGPFLLKREKSIYLDIFQVFATIGAICGLYAAFIDENPIGSGEYEDSLTTMHSWIGIAALILIFGSFFWFSILRLTGDFGPLFVHDWMNYASWVSTILPMMAIWLTVLAIGTGISDFLGQGTCYPTGQSGVIDYSNPSTPVYPYIPEGCKLGNGVGIASTFAACFTFLGVAYLVPMKMKKEVQSTVQIQSTKAHNKSSRNVAAEYDYVEPTPIDTANSFEGEITMLVRRGLKASLDMNANKRNSVERSRASEYQSPRRSQEFIRGSVDSTNGSPRNRTGSVTKSLETIAAPGIQNLTTIELRNKRPSSSRIIESTVQQKISPRDGTGAPVLQKQSSNRQKYQGIGSSAEKDGDWW